MQSQRPSCSRRCETHQTKVPNHTWPCSFPRAIQRPGQRPPMTPAHHGSSAALSKSGSTTGLNISAVTPQASSDMVSCDVTSCDTAPSKAVAGRQRTSATNTPAPPQNSGQRNTSSSSSSSSSSSGNSGASAAMAAPVSRRTAGLALASATAAAVLSPPQPVEAAAAPEGGGGSGGGGVGRFSVQPASPAGQLLQEGAAGGRGHGGGESDNVLRPQRRVWPPVPLVPLARGLRVSKVLRGCWQLSGRHKGDPITDRTSGGEAVADLAAFHRAGITTLDTADNYGPAELLVGRYLRLYPGDAPGTTIATKLSYLSDEDMTTASRTMVEYAVRNSLVRLGRERLDLVQLQWADPVRHRRWLDVLRWLADLREEGLISHVGVCNFAVPQLAAAMDAGVGIVSNQVQFSLIDRRPQLYMQKAAASYGVKLLVYGTVAGGLLSDKYYNAPASKVRLDTASKHKYGLIIRQAGGGTMTAAAGGGGGGGWAWMQEVLEATRTVAQRYGVSSSTVATAWVLHQPQVTAAIVGARNARHIRDMQAACALQLDDGDMLDLDAVWEGVPQPPTSDVYVWERGGAW